MTPEQLEFEVMVNRYRYYVLCEATIPDKEYDLLERKAREALPPDSPVQGVGSNLPSSYSVDVIHEANRRSK